MATRRRDVAPRKDKIGQSPSRTPNRSVATSNVPPKTNTLQTHDPKKHITTSLRTAVRSSTNDVHKQLVKKPTPIDSSAHRPTQTTRRTLDKNPSPAAQKTRAPTNPYLQQTTPLSTQKTRVSNAPSLPSHVKTPLSAQKTQVSTSPSLQLRDKTAPPAHKTSAVSNPSLRPHDKTPLPARKTQASPGQFPGKTIACEKTVPGKNLKALNKDNGRHSLHETPVSTTLKMSSAGSGQETEIIPTSTKKEQTNYTFQENDENLNIYQNLPEVETLLEDQELVTFFLQQEIQTVENGEQEEQIILKVTNDGENSITDLAMEGDQEKPLDIVGIKAENHDDDGAKIITITEPSPAPPDVKTQESEEKPFVEQKLEEHSVQEIVDNTNDINKSVSNDYHKEEDEVKVEVVVEVIEKVLDKKDEVAGQSEVHESGETKEPEVVVKPNQESENKAQKQGGTIWKKDSVVSNNAIEETATKLRDQRVNRVRALAGAFESVMQ